MIQALRGAASDEFTLDVVVCLWEPTWSSLVDSWTYRIIGKSDSALTLEGLANE